MDKFEEIKKYKELFDSGVITQEEFEKKKKELLETQATSTSKVLEGIITGAKEKSEQARAAASEKLEELKKKQAEEAEKKMPEYEGQKINHSTTIDDNEIGIPVSVVTDGEIHTQEGKTKTTTPGKK